jgi:hypothetical protein
MQKPPTTKTLKRQFLLWLSLNSQPQMTRLGDVRLVYGVGALIAISVALGKFGDGIRVLVRGVGGDEFLAFALWTQVHFSVADASIPIHANRVLTGFAALRGAQS